MVLANIPLDFAIASNPTSYKLPADLTMTTNPKLNFPQGMLAGQTAIITGAAQGIGAETAAILAREGCKVVIADIDGIRANSTAQTINSDGGAAIAVAGDITSNDAIDNLIQQTVDFSGGKIHIIVNNAGYAWDDSIDKIQDKQWGKDTIISLHNTAPFKLIRAAAPYFMVKDGEPRSIVNISSTSGIYGNAGQASYALAKAGLVGLTKTVAQEWGPEYGVRANTVAFGSIKTRLTQAPKGEYVVRPDGTNHAVGFHGGYDEEEKWSDWRHSSATNRIAHGSRESDPRRGITVVLLRDGSGKSDSRSLDENHSNSFNSQTIMVTGGKGGM
ncbi:hypothetical protein MBLNU459_g2818t2 [Dothideomycetes sp. NU459]